MKQAVLLIGVIDYGRLSTKRDYSLFLAASAESHSIAMATFLCKHIKLAVIIERATLSAVF